MWLTRRYCARGWIDCVQINVSMAIELYVPQHSMRARLPAPWKYGTAGSWSTLLLRGSALQSSVRRTATDGNSTRAAVPIRREQMPAWSSHARKPSSQSLGAVRLARYHWA